jgi:hypothetical protein
MSDAIVCRACGGALTLPAHDTLSMRCPYCGDAQPVPPQYLAVLVEREREKRAAAERAEVRADRHRSLRTKLLLYLALPFAGMAAVGVFIFVIVEVYGKDAVIVNGRPLGGAAEDDEPVPPPPTDPHSTGKDVVDKLVAAKVAEGCKVVDADRSSPSSQLVNEWKLPAGSCVYIIAATGMPGNQLTLQLQDVNQTSIGSPITGAQVSLPFCPTKTGSYGYKIDTGDNQPFTWADLQCADAESQ